MIKLLAALAAFLFVGMWFLGADHGQFINPPRPALASEAPSGTVATIARPVFIPARRVMQAAPVALAQTDGAALPQPSDAPILPVLPAQPEPQLAAIKLMHVPGGASVRSGPGRQFGVIGDLSGGDVVTAIDVTSAPGWVRVRVDGRSKAWGEGWVAAKLLRE